MPFYKMDISVLVVMIAIYLCIECERHGSRLPTPLGHRPLGSWLQGGCRRMEHDKYHTHHLLHWVGRNNEGGGECVGCGGGCGGDGREESANPIRTTKQTCIPCPVCHCMPVIYCDFKRHCVEISCVRS